MTLELLGIRAAEMYTLMAMTRSCSIAEVRDGLTGFVHEVERGATIHITRRGKPTAVLMSEATYAKLIEARPTFAQAYSAWLRAQGTVPSAEIAINSGHFDGVRDRSEGRRVKL
jgi:prevent-host-death family protein